MKWKSTGKDRLYGFMKPNLTLSIRKPEVTSALLLVLLLLVFNRTVVGKFF